MYLQERVEHLLLCSAKTDIDYGSGRTRHFPRMARKFWTGVFLLFQELLDRLCEYDFLVDIVEEKNWRKEVIW